MMTRSNIAYQTPNIRHNRVAEWVCGLLFVLLLLSAYAWFDEREERGYWQQEVERQNKKQDLYSKSLVFAVREDGQCSQRDVRKNWELATGRMCDMVKAHLSVSR